MVKPAQPGLILSALALTLSAFYPIASQAQSEDWPEENQIYQSFSVDLNQDGKPEKVEVKAIRVGESGYTGQLFVKNPAGAVIWQGPLFEPGRDSIVDNELYLGSFPMGEGRVSLVQDLEGDGRVDLLMAVPQSDLRVRMWRIFTWNGKGFVFSAKGCLLEVKPGSGQFSFVERTAEQGNWVDAIRFEGKDLFAEILMLKPGDLRGGIAKMKINADGMRLLNWVEPPRSYNGK
ncbi:MAG: hypothetical protein AB7I41_08570 [Candidatus Sericytochromatia bacterium]